MRRPLQVIILLMTSGYMWNQIRHPAYVQVAQGGRVNYVAGGYSSQLGAETHIVSVVCAPLSVLPLPFTACSPQ
jgi:oligosaccharyltransferase complex subunit gamma